MANSGPPPIFRMPVAFGPMPGPRQDQAGRRFDWTDNPEKTVFAVRFETELAALESLLPEGFTLAGEPIVTIEVQYLRKLRWLAGRGYATLGVRFPARFVGEQDDVTGSFLLLLWENLADPIISGREELGYNKLFADISDPVEQAGRTTIKAGWGGTSFFEMTLDNLVGTSNMPSGGEPRIDGVLHHKYIPATGDWGSADADYAVLTPAEGSAALTVSIKTGSGQIQFSPADWHAFPTLNHIITRLADLPVLGWLPASRSKQIGGKDLRDQRRLA